MLLLGLGWLTSSTNVFVKDVSKLVGIIVQFGFWLTPIFWNISRVPQEYQWIIKLNPAYYLVSGYRDCLLYHRWFWERQNETLYFWALTTVILFLGIIVFKRLRPHFAEVIKNIFRSHVHAWKRSLKCSASQYARHSLMNSHSAPWELTYICVILKYKANIFSAN